MKSDLTIALQAAGRDISRAWVRACDAMIARAGATAESHKLISEAGHMPGEPAHRAWLVPNGESWKPVRYPCVEMRRRDDDMAITINLVEAPESRSEKP